LPGIDRGTHLLDLGEPPRGRPYADARNRAEQILLSVQLGRLVHLLLNPALRLGQLRS